MKFFENVLTESTVRLFTDELQDKATKNCWRVSSLFWDQKLLIGFTGSCYAAVVSDELKTAIITDLKDKLPKSNDILIQQYIWGKNSGIAWHHDQNYDYGATIYLNNEWDSTYGGVFLYETDQGLCGYNPKFNTMVLNDQCENHMVTQISPHASEFRTTIQIWGF